MSVTSLRSRMIEAFRAKLFILMALVGAVFIIFLFQLINLQFIQGSDYVARARSNMEDFIPVPASRGEIYDRHFQLGTKTNNVLASNRPSFNITMVPAKFETVAEMESVVTRVAGVLGVDAAEILKEVRAANRWQRIVIKEDVPFEAVVTIASHEELFPHISWEDSPVRVYNHGPAFAHALGYIGSITTDEYDRLKNQGYKYYQKVGKTGIERQYDSVLRGTDGNMKRIVDVRRRTEGEEMGTEPLAGNNMVLTLDYELQMAAWKAMEGKMGSVIAMKPATGEVLVVLSKPDFDPNMLIAKTSNAVIAELTMNDDKPFLNRGIQSIYPPASTFKLVTSIAALEEDKWKPDWTFYCPSYYILKGLVDRSYQCYKRQSHGTLDMYGAIGKSCNVYFYNLGYKIGPTSIMKYAEYFGLNQLTGIDLPGEKAGVVPSKQWKMKTFGQSWFDGDTINLAIGQGFTSITPIELAQFVSSVVNSGVAYKPYMVKEVRSQDNLVIVKKNERTKLREVPLTASTVTAVTTGMRRAVQEGGTAARLSYLKVPIAGKTGTVQTRSKIKADDSQHAWFVGFAPFGGSPEQAVVVVVMVEYGVAGAIAAVPVAEAVFSKMIQMGYFNVPQS